MSQKILKSAIFLVLLVIVAVGVFFAIQGDDEPISEDTADNVRITQASEKSEDITDEAEQQTDESSPEEDKDADDTVPDDLNIVDGDDLTIDELKQENGIIFVSASIISESQGECLYNFVADETRPITRTNDAFIQDDRYVCYVDINEAEFTKLGPWQAEVVFTAGEESYKATEDFDVQ